MIMTKMAMINNSTPAVFMMLSLFEMIYVEGEGNPARISA